MEALSSGDGAIVETHPTFVLRYMGTLLATNYEVELWMKVHRRGTVMEVHGALLQKRPEPVQRLPLLPVALELPNIREAGIAIPSPFTGEIKVSLLDDGATVQGSGRLGIDLPISSTHFHLLRFESLIGIAR